MRRIVAVPIALLLVGPATAAAQDPPTVIFAQYMRCSPAQQSRANEIERTLIQPLAQKHVDAGRITGTGYRVHQHGGPWRSYAVLNGTDVNTMLEVQSQLVAEFQTQHPAEAAEYSNICSSHDDYIWTSVATAPANPGAAQPPASLSTYYVCDRSREGRADEIFQTLLAPLYKKHTDMGHLSSWGFFAHRSGGMFRRLETFAGADHATLLDMQAAIYAEAGETDALAFNEFMQICGTHTDYMWINP